MLLTGLLCLDHRVCSGVDCGVTCSDDGEHEIRDCVHIRAHGHCMNLTRRRMPQLSQVYNNITVVHLGKGMRAGGERISDRLESDSTPRECKHEDAPSQKIRSPGTGLVVFLADRFPSCKRARTLEQRTSKHLCFACAASTCPHLKLSGSGRPKRLARTCAGETVSRTQTGSGRNIKEIRTWVPVAPSLTSEPKALKYAQRVRPEQS